MAIRQRRRSDDSFFANGDHVAFHSTFFFTENDKENSNICHKIEKQSIDNTSEYEQQSLLYTFSCCAPHCSKVFNSLEECEAHYIQNHTFECQHCGKFFPNDSILDLHLQESHDAYFLSAVQKQKAKYQCLVCNASFSTELERARHLQGIHGYPKWFRFHSNRHVMLNSVKRKMKWWRNKRVEYATTTTTNHLDDDQCENSTTNEKENAVVNAISTRRIEEEKVPEETNGKEKKKTRKERKKLNNARIPCRFYNTKAGCWRGDNCMFLHSKQVDVVLQNNEPNQYSFPLMNSDCNTYGSNMDIDEEVEKLTTQIQSKARISIPDNISFGRRKRR